MFLVKRILFPTDFSPCANEALDHGSFRMASSQVVLQYLQCTSVTGDEEVGLLVSFDGACRDNPGDASLGVCAWWGKWCSGSFQEEGCFLRRGVRLGIGTNNTAEAEAMAVAIREALRWHFEVTEALAEFVGRPSSSTRSSWMTL